MKQVSEEAKQILDEIIKNEKVADYWEKRFEDISARDDIVLRGCFGELSENGLIHTLWADNYPYYIQVSKDGYLYDEHLKNNNGVEVPMTRFREDLKSLLERANHIKPPVNARISGTSISEYNKPSRDWVNDFEIFYNKYLKEHFLSNRIDTLLSRRDLHTYEELVSCLSSISKDDDFLSKMDVTNDYTNVIPQVNTHSEYDVFLSHANKDKKEIVEDLNNSLEKLGINIFYDRKTLEWGDNWKKRILDGTEKAEFAIIVISENFFGREWTEIELKQFLNRQNKNGQKIILPILHNVGIEDLCKEYPLLGDIQAINSSEYTCDQIALLFARQLIKRLR